MLHGNLCMGSILYFVIWYHCQNSISVTHLSLHSEVIYQMTMNFSSGRGLWRCHVQQTHFRSTVFRLVSLSEMSSDAEGPNLYLFVLIYFMGIRGESVQLGKLWARNGVTTTNHHSEPALFFNRGLSVFLSVSKGSWHLHDRLSSALKGSSLTPQLAEVLTSSSSIYRGQIFQCTQL